MIKTIFLNLFNLKKAAYLLFLLFTINSYSQNIIIGKITNSKNSPIELANVQIINIQTKNTLTFIQTDKLGFFRLEVKEKAIYNLKITAFGYAALIKKLN